MNAPYVDLFNELNRNIQQYMQLETPERERVEKCFWIANHYWGELKKLVKDHGFRNEEMEIDFYRNVKPRFTSYMEYFAILSEALTFVPEEYLHAFNFWDNEMQRYKRFRNKHQEFIDYYESGLNYLDARYFLRQNNGLGFAATVPVYDADIAFSTSHDQYVRSYLAHKKYHDYAKQRKEVLHVQVDHL